MGKLDGKVAIVTGGARGMGGATSRLFAAEGAKVAIADVLEAEGAALAREIGESARFYRHDVTSEEAWASLVVAVEADLGPVDVLVNNAGILMFKTLLETSLAEYRRVIDVNLVGEFLGIKAVAPGMIARGRGSIVNVSSVDGMKGANGLAAYASSKWGVRGLTRVAAMELGHRGVRVNSVHPGGVDTAMTNYDASPREKVDERFGNIPLQRIGGPEEVARARVALILSKRVGAFSGRSCGSGLADIAGIAFVALRALCACCASGSGQSRRSTRTICAITTRIALCAASALFAFQAGKPLIYSAGEAIGYRNVIRGWTGFALIAFVAFFAGRTGNRNYALTDFQNINVIVGRNF